MPATGPSEAALGHASADLHSRLKGDVEILWDDGEPATREVHKLTVIARHQHIVLHRKHERNVARDDGELVNLAGRRLAIIPQDLDVAFQP